MSSILIKSQYQNTSWQQQLSSAFKSISELCHYLELDESEIKPTKTQQNFPLRVPRSFASCMEKGNPNDPLLKQVMPIADEMLTVAGFSNDPVGDLNAMTETGVIHKYHGRALLINTGSCAIHCRYCFRRNFPYGERQLSKKKQQNALTYLKNHPEISEIILSGGDPLLLSDNKLSELIQAFNQIESIKRIRIHSRLPIVLPARINEGLIKALTQTHKQIIMVVHSNHANELSLEVAQAVKAMRQAGISLLNQSVLLKDINDNVLALCHLSEKLFENGIMPYYLHLLDKAQGTAHFEVSKTDALLLMQQVQARLSGYLVPKLVQEEAGKNSKTIIF